MFIILVFKNVNIKRFSSADTYGKGLENDRHFAILKLSQHHYLVKNLLIKN